MKKSNLLLAGTLLLSMSMPLLAEAGLTSSYQFNGKGNWSLDAVGGNNTPIGNLQAFVPVGSVIEKAFLYTSGAWDGTFNSVTFDGTAYNSSSFTALGYNGGLQAYRLDVTEQVKNKIGGGSASEYSFAVNNESVNFGIDGEALAIVYSNPLEKFRTIGFLDGFATFAGNTTTVNFSSPLIDPTTAGFEALMSLGIGFSYQPAGQYSRVDVNGQRLTTSAGGWDDGSDSNGGLITMGGLGDNTANPVNPLATDVFGSRYDDELYNLANGGFLNTGDTSMTVYTENTSFDDSIFFLGLNVTANAGIDAPPPPDPNAPVPEPSTMLLLGSGLAGLAFWRKRKQA